jgi:hypothetical protein
LSRTPLVQKFTGTKVVAYCGTQVLAYFVKNPTEGAESARKAVECFVECVKWYSEQGATVMCLSCTEIPVVLKESVLRSHKDLAGLNLHIVDSVVALGQMITDHIMKEEEGEEEENQD